MNLSKILLTTLSVIFISPIVLQAALRRTPYHTPIATNFLSTFIPSGATMAQRQSSQFNSMEKINPYKSMKTKNPLWRNPHVTAQQRTHSNQKLSDKQEEANRQPSNLMIGAFLALYISDKFYTQYKYPRSTMYTINLTKSWFNEPSEDEEEYEEEASLNLPIANFFKDTPNDRAIWNKLYEKSNGEITPRTHRIISRTRTIKRSDIWNIRVQPISQEEKISK